MCKVCDFGRTPTCEEIKENILYISWCKNVTEIELPKGLQILYCDGCTNLTSLGPLPKGLQKLFCSGCTGLTSLGTLPESLQTLHCSGCTNLTNLGPLPEGFQELFCRDCTNFTSLGPLPESLKTLYCYGCTNFTSLGPLPKSLRYLYCGGCSLLTQMDPLSVIDNLDDYWPSTWSPSEDLEENLKKLVILQKFCRSFRTRKLLKLSKTRKFCEWFYHPENYGGRWAKKSLNKLFC